MKNIIKITKKELTNIVKEAINETIALGVFNECSRLDEMARVGFMEGGYEVYVRTDDPGYIPHVHVRDENTHGKEFETCIQLNTNRYFLHGHYKDILNSQQRKDFAKFMEGPSRNPKYRNNYEYAVDMWNDNNSSSSVTVVTSEDGDIVIPDYRNID
jgi:hypothetical protein